MVADNKLGGEGMAALAPALDDLVSITSLGLGSTYAVMCGDRVALCVCVCVCVFCYFFLF